MWILRRVLDLFEFIRVVSSQLTFPPQPDLQLSLHLPWFAMPTCHPLWNYGTCNLMVMCVLKFWPLYISSYRPPTTTLETFFKPLDGHWFTYTFAISLMRTLCANDLLLCFSSSIFNSVQVGDLPLSTFCTYQHFSFNCLETCDKHTLPHYLFLKCVYHQSVHMKTRDKIDEWSETNMTVL